MAILRDEPSLNNADAIVNFTGVNHNSKWFQYKQKITGVTGANDTKNYEKMVPLKYLSNFLRTVEMPLINCEINLILTWSKNCVIVSNATANQETTFAIPDTKLYVPVVTLSTQDNAKLLEQLNQLLKEQLIGTNINQKYQYKRQTHI